MKAPKKIEITVGTGTHSHDGQEYNQAIDDWEQWFKSKQKDLPPEISNLIDKHFWELI